MTKSRHLAAEAARDDKGIADIGTAIERCKRNVLLARGEEQIPRLARDDTADIIDGGLNGDILYGGLNADTIYAGLKKGCAVTRSIGRDTRNRRSRTITEPYVSLLSGREAEGE